MRLRKVAAACLLFGLLTGCVGAAGDAGERPGAVQIAPTAAPTVQDMPTPTAQREIEMTADVISVAVSGEPGAYRFSVEIRSPDRGCDQYADWWEVLTEEGALLYRRILAHSHVNEQPFTRSGGPVPVDPDSVVLVRAHMAPGGYGGVVLRGTPEGGFVRAEVEARFAADLADQPPLPDGCAF